MADLMRDRIERACAAAWRSFRPDLHVEGSQSYFPFHKLAAATQDQWREAIAAALNAAPDPFKE